MSIKTKEKIPKSILFRDSKDIKCHLDLTGEQDRIVCICGGFSVIDFNATKNRKKNIVTEFCYNHRKCK